MATTFGKLDFHTSFKPSSAFPLDSREYLESYAEALACAQKAVEAGSADSNYYYGQVLRVVENGIASLYQIQPDNTLTPVGGGAAIEGVTDRVDTVEGKVETLENNYTLMDTLTGELKTKTEALETKTGELETAVNGIDDKIATAVAAANHLEFTIVDSKDAIDATAEDAGKYVYLVSKYDSGEDVYDEYMVINGAIELIGHTKVDLAEYAKTADIESQYVKKEDGKRLITDAEGEKIGAMLLIKSVSDELAVSEDGELAVQAIGMDKVTSLADELAKKVDKVEGSRLITELEAQKIEQLVLNDDGSVGISGKVNAENVQGLQPLLDAKVDKAEGSRLMLDTEGTKLAAIEDGAQANVIETIMAGGVALEILEKSVNIPVAGEKLGLVKANAVENGIAIDEAGAMTVHTLNVNKLVQSDDEDLVLNGGSAAG